MNEGDIVVEIGDASGRIEEKLDKIIKILETIKTEITGIGRNTRD